MNLPEPNQSAVLWSDEDGSVVVRLRIECIAVPWPRKRDPEVRRYVLHAESCGTYEDDDGTTVEEWMASSVPPEALSRTMRLLPDLGRVGSPMVASILRAIVKGKPKFPTEAPAKIARAQGWSVTLSPQGSMCNGDPLFGIEFSRPLMTEEMVAFIGQLAKALDHYERDQGDR